MRLSTSVVLCTCNGSRFLAAQWDSLLAQERLPDEIVVRDDASSDGTWTLLGKLSARAKSRGVQVRLIRNERNLGYVANFEAALKDTSGDVVFLCDQDDIWHPGKLAALTEAFERRPGLLLLCTDARRVDEAGASLRRSLFDVLKISRVELRRIHGTAANAAGGRAALSDRMGARRMVGDHRRGVGRIRLRRTAVD